MKAAAALLALVAGAAATNLRRDTPGNYQWPVGVTLDVNFKGFYDGWTPSAGQQMPAGFVMPACFRTQYCKAVVTVTQYLPAPTPAPTTPPTGPTPLVTVITSPGVYTIAGTTVTVTGTTTILVPTSTALTPGVNTYGGVVTKVVDATTVVCPYEKTVVTNGVTTTIVDVTTVYCPSAGVYTIVPPVQTTVAASTVVVYPVPATLTPGVYTRPQVIVTATVVNQIVICPYNGVYQTQVWTEPPAVPAVAIAVVTPVPAPQAAAKVAAAPGPLANGNKWAITYTPYTTTGQCKSAGEVMVDLQLIASKGFASVRLYATDCSGLDNVGAAAKAAGLKLIIGVFIKSDGLGAAAPQVDDIVRWGSRDGNFAIVTMIVVGNEAVFNGYTTAVALAAFIGDAKGRFVAAGFVGVITTTEPLNILQASGAAFCAVVDVVGANIQPFFNSGVVAAQAGSFVASQLALVAQICPGKQAYNLESGWPSAGAPNGAAVPGRAEQQAAIADILAKVGDRTVFFSFTDDAWKHAGVFGVEQNFGCSGLF